MGKTFLGGGGMSKIFHQWVRDSPHSPNRENLVVLPPPSPKKVCKIFNIPSSWGWGWERIPCLPTFQKTFQDWAFEYLVKIALWIRKKCNSNFVLTIAVSKVRYDSIMKAKNFGLKFVISGTASTIHQRIINNINIILTKCSSFQIFIKLY